MVRNRAKLNVEQLESRENPTNLIWNGNPLFEPNFSNQLNWINPATQLPPLFAPGQNDDLYFTGFAQPCYLNVNAQVKSLTIDPQLSSSSSFVLHMLNHTLTTGKFQFNAGTILFGGTGGEFGHLVIEGDLFAEWKDEADFLGNMGTVELNKGTQLKILGIGQKDLNTQIVIGSPADQVKSVLATTEDTQGSLELGQLGKITVSLQGALIFENSGNFYVNAEEENPRRINVEGILEQLGEGVTTLNVGVDIKGVSSLLLVSHGALVIDDPNNLLSVDQSWGEVALDRGTTFAVMDGFLQSGGYFTLYGDGLGQFEDKFITRGDFYFNSEVLMLQNFINPKAIRWDNSIGEIVFGDDNILSMNVSGLVDCVDTIICDQITLGGELYVNENALVQQGMKLDMFGGRNTLLFGEFGLMKVNGVQLEQNWLPYYFLDSENIRWWGIEKL